MVDPTLLQRLNLKVGDAVMIGTEQVGVAAALKSEPDALSDPPGPRIFISEATLDKSGLIEPSRSVRWRYAAGGKQAGEEELKSLRARVTAELPEAAHDHRPPRSLSAGDAHAAGPGCGSS